MQHVIDTLRQATTFAEVFGALGGDAPTQKRSLRIAFGQAAKYVHPDTVPSEQRLEANEAIYLLNTLREKADAAIDVGKYDESFTALSITTTEIRSAKEVYTVPDNPRWRGEFSAVYEAQRQSDKARVVMKIALKPKSNGVLEHEDRVTQKLVSKKVPYVDATTDVFVIMNGSRRLRVTVYPFVDGMFSLTEIRDRMGRALDPRDAAWIWRRVIGQVMAASKGKVVHGAIIPHHVLVHPVTHEVRHIGWTQAVPPGMCVVRPQPTWCAPEMLIDEPVDERSDIYMAGQTMMYLIDKQIKGLPAEISHTLRWAVEENPADRPDCGERLLERLTISIRKAWGKQYRQLVLP